MFILESEKFKCTHLNCASVLQTIPTIYFFAFLCDKSSINGNLSLS